MSSGLLHEVETILLKLTLDNGVTGWGETCPLGTTYAPAHAKGAVAALVEVLPGLIGQPAAPLPVHERMNALLAGHAYAKAAVDIALHDAMGHHFGVPVSTLLSGALRDSVPAYYAIGIGTPEETAQAALDKVGAGYRRLQFKMGGRDCQEDIAAIRAVASAVHDARVQLVLDANRGWSVAEAMTVSQALRDVALIIEQPCKTIAEHRQLRLRLCHPLYLDESMVDLNTAIDVMGEGLAEGFGMKVTRLGGLAPAATFRDLCAARNLPHTCDDNWGGDLIAAACLHLAATMQADLLQGVWIAADHIADVPGYPCAIRAKDGQLDVPQSPGLGVSVDEAQLGAPEVDFT